MAVAGLLLLVMLAGSVLYYNRDGIRGQSIKRRLRTAARWPIAELPENQAGRIVGTVQATADLLTSPLTGRQCVLYQVLIEEQGVAVGSWNTVAAELTTVPFLIVDDSGRAVVDARASQVELAAHSITSGLLDRPNDGERTLLARHGRDHRSGARYRESIVKAGDRIAILGYGTREPDPETTDSPHRGTHQARLRLTSTLRHPMIITDDPKLTR